MSYTKQQMQILDLKAQNRRLRKTLAEIIAQNHKATEQAPQKRKKRIVT